MVDFFGSIATVALGAAFALLAVLAFVLKGLYLIRSGEVGVLVKRLGGRKMPPGQVIARNGGIGTQAGTLVPGLFWRMPGVWRLGRAKGIQVAGNEIGTVEACHGRPLPEG